MFREELVKEIENFLENDPICKPIASMRIELAEGRNLWVFAASATNILAVIVSPEERNDISLLPPIIMEMYSSIGGAANLLAITSLKDVKEIVQILYKVIELKQHIKNGGKIMIDSKDNVEEIPKQANVVSMPKTKRGH